MRRKSAETDLLVEDGAENGDSEVGELRSAFIELQPADYAMLGEIPGNPRLGNAQMLAEKRFQIGIPPARGAGARKSADGDAQRVAGFYMRTSSESSAWLPVFCKRYSAET